MIWFTSDEHIGHKNIIRFCNRPFDDLDHMKDELVRRHNEVVGPKDEVYHLGDIAFKHTLATDYLGRLNGRHYHIRGNHDPKGNTPILGFVWSKDTKVVKFRTEDPEYGAHEFYLSHYAHRVWPKSHYGTYHVYGHSHGELPGVGRSMDVGVDAHNYYPISAKQVITKLIAQPYGVHHEKNSNAD
jgi:calcineurin-like phosphoesterase family protein